MNQSNNGGILEQFVNTVMGVKTGNQQQSPNTSLATKPELDINAVLVYKLGTILQIGVMILVLLGMEKLIMFIDNNSDFTSWFSTMLTALFFAVLSIRSRIFSLLDNTRSRTTYDQVIRPRWSPPPLAFPIVWMIIAVLRVISSVLVWQEMNHQFLVLPLILFVVHLALGDTWNTIFTVERRLGAAVPVVILGPWLSALVVTAIYWQTVPLAGMILSFSCVWLTVATALVFRIWQLNGSEPLYPLKLAPVQK
ncbi:TspO/MBR family protein [Nodularia spumigena CS-584]|jgi:translocator protein|uniref:TspO/MBR family protein n=1 Tax=Nodularia spumigena UHCC 0060 TaxID=3110300 RepID=A0ABU5UVS6_NODSP|nr:TspO/MBR family protein [Nodularia spumigena]AHJ31074.1 TspO-like protein [Nodularia spumigena CCY9414]EAW43402.1 TspO and MBR-like protein [Nodularia spumigena CCY9414]MDB9384108.1 TspO/MBR family protein [Nodularia spumigena CS-584]MEA5527064.1 TspO/MBR family protein [Nodularia spumigena UHCC 0143]MEA5610388.1 TspO/MBR family protein [Nodularia spumigena UHCC 0060]